ncbi:MAG TPA: M12 family metallo-peptidase [Planctomycetota bacterium]|nr:M12 family metallo-peptidase [Planctomycetota bacterium]
MLSTSQVSLVLAAAIGGWSDASEVPARSSPSAELQRLALPPEPGWAFEVSVSLDGEVHALFLEPHSVRAAGFQLLVQGAGGTLLPVEAPAPRTYRGRILDEPGSVVTASLHPSGLRAVITGPTLDAAWEVEPLGQRDERGPLHRIRRAEADPSMEGCGVDDQVVVERPGESLIAYDGGYAICEISIDCDVDFYEYNGSDVGATLTAAEDRVNGVKTPYEDYLDVTFELGTVIVRTDPGSDPYASYGGNFATLLDLFREQWNTNHTSILRDTAHLLTNKAGNASGISSPGAICSCQSYAVSRAAPLTPLYANMLVAHELGHLFGAAHCNAYPNCWIMCSSIGGCSGALLQFSSHSINAIQAVPDMCLSNPMPTAPPVLTGISMPQVPALGVVPTTLTGTGLADTKKMRVVAPWGEIVEDCSFVILDDFSLKYFTPSPLALGPVYVSAIGTPGSSNAIQFEYIATDPPLTVAPPVLFPPLTATWKVGSEPGLTAVLTLALNDGSTTTSGGYTLLANGTPIPLGTLDAAGLGSYSRWLPEVLAPGTIYTQLTVFDSGVLVGASNIHVMELEVPIGTGP